MARAGLGANWRCLFANDCDQMKAATYTANWGANHLVCGDVADLATSDLPDRADLVWASFPCQDLSLAGGYAGLGRAASSVRTRSGTFWPFWELMVGLRREGRAPTVIVLENVVGALTSHGGKDFSAIGGALVESGYRFGVLVIDAIRFVPQSRPRVFFVAVDAELDIPDGLEGDAPSSDWCPRALVDAHAGLAKSTKEAWIWWRLPPPPSRNTSLADLIEDNPTDVNWHTPEETAYLLAMMSPANEAKVTAVGRLGRKTVGCVYRRTRRGPDGVKRQRAEVRFDGVAGCLRTPAGGSSRQTVVVVNGDWVRSRLLSSRETARLMGLVDDYKLPARYNDAYHVTGDGVCPPVVRHLAEWALEPVISSWRSREKLIAAE
jgi:DNA (cytosine-5)-methyltransferase 1